MFNLQYFVFDQTGQHILEANAFPCESESELFALRDHIVENYKTQPELKNVQLTLVNCNNGQVLFNSRKGQ